MARRSPEKEEAQRIEVLKRLLESYHTGSPLHCNASQLAHSIPKHPTYGFVYSRYIPSLLEGFLDDKVIGTRRCTKHAYGMPATEYFIMDPDAIMEYVTGLKLKAA